MLAIDALVLLALAAIGGATTWVHAQAIDPVLFSYGPDAHHTSDVWFDGYIPKVYGGFTHRLHR